jgi:hypothetical protein
VSQHLSLIALVRRFAVHANPVRLVRGLVIACFALLCGVAFAQSAMTDRAFDHATTGFSLSNQHITARCESCHVQGVFRGTPRECSSCHRNASRPNATQFPLQHIPTTLQCDICHKSVDWGIVMFRHQGVTKGSCLTCHNGVFASQLAIGKPATHLTTTASCDNCHNTLTWTATTYNHAGVVPGTCANCHNGVKATGKRASHIPTTASCDTCHTTNTWITKYNHNGVAPGSCATCHNRVTTTGKGREHIPTSAACDACHKNYVSFTPAMMDHTGLNGQCSTCHSGSYLSQNAQTKPANHVATTAQCDTCHNSTTSWATATFDHTKASPAVTVGDHTCANCHKAGGPGLSMPSTHIPTNNACDICHTNFTRFRPATMSHDGTAGQCSSCHNGTYATGKSKLHVTTSAQCDTCHSISAWSPAHYVHDSLAAHRCSVCHNGTVALGKGGTHIPDNRECDTCHTSTTSFQLRTMNHTGLAGQCLTCHSGGYVSENAQTKSASHQITTAQCDSCHTSTTTWATAAFNHSGVTIGGGTCGTCHVTGGSGLPKPTSHIPTTAACDTCHKNFTAFKPASMSHTGTAAQCSTCHSGGYVSVNAQTWPTTHKGGANPSQCDNCHTTTAWKPARTTHDATSAGRCSTCHNGATATGKGAGHIPDTRQCDTCHGSTASFRTATTMNHTGWSNQCATCHNGNYTSYRAEAKSTGHIPTTAQCDVCHRTSAWMPLLTPYSHSGIAAGSCKNCHVSSYRDIDVMPTNHITTNASCDTCHSTSAWKPAAYHTAASTGQCDKCHNGTSATGKISGHIPTTAQCDACHRTSAWMPLITPYSHSGVAAGSCKNCHVSTYRNIDYMTTTHMPTNAACDQCHKMTDATWPIANSPANHTALHTGTAGQCAGCHEYNNRWGLTERVPNKHTSKNPARLAPNSCDNSNCHSTRGF